jgi:tetratricopeptide (TPR) repeat protein
MGMDATIRLIVGGSIALAALALPAPASADDRTDPVDLFEEGAQAFKEGDLELAIEKFRAAYELEPNPILLYNMARAHEGLDEPEAAVRLYRRYLEDDPETSDRGAVQARIEALDKEIARRRELEARRKAPPPAPPEEPSAIPWVIAGIGGAGVIVGSVLGGLSLAKESEANDAPVANDAAALADEARGFATGAGVSWIVGGALLVAGTVWGVVDLTSLEEGADVALRIELGPRLGLAGRF